MTSKFIEYSILKYTLNNIRNENYVIFLIKGKMSDSQTRIIIDRSTTKMETFDSLHSSILLNTQKLMA